MACKKHTHIWTSLWSCFGPYRPPPEVHYHPCHDPDCSRVLVGLGRNCDGKGFTHWRETL